MPDMAIGQWAALAFAAVVIGLSKTGLPGAAILAIPLLADVFPAKASTGIILPMLITADLFAVTYYRRKAVWSHLIHLIPWATGGIVIGHALMRRISDARLMPVIGAIVLIVLALNAWRRHVSDPDTAIPQHWWFAAAIGLTAGITTMMANAAGPVMIVYLVAMRLPKQAFVGTGAWYFFLLNWFKVPFSADLGLITRDSLMLNAIMAPLVALGALTGIFLLRRIPQKGFTAAVEILAALAAIRLLWP